MKTRHFSVKNVVSCLQLYTPFDEWEVSVCSNNARKTREGGDNYYFIVGRGNIGIFLEHKMCMHAMLSSVKWGFIDRAFGFSMIFRISPLHQCFSCQPQASVRACVFVNREE